MTLLKLEYLYLNLDRIDALSLENPGKPRIWGAGLDKNFQLEDDEGQAFEYVIRQIVANPNVTLPLVIDCMKVWAEKLPIGRVVEQANKQVLVDGIMMDPDTAANVERTRKAMAPTIPRINSSKIRDAIRKRGSMPPDLLPGE